MEVAEQDFTYIRDLVEKEAAIVLDKGKEYLVASRIGPIAKESGFSSLADLVTAIKNNKSSELKFQIVEALTTNETSFYRDLEPFEALKETIIPELIKKREASKELTIWSAAASSGQEIYSIAMMLRETFPQLVNWKLNLFGTDISPQILEKAKNGVYTQFEVNRGLPATLLVKYFEKDGRNWKIKDDLKKMVSFSELNLIRPWGNLPQCDIVLIRNVLIYFNPEVKKSILHKIKSVMRPDGYLFLGAAETTLNLDETFKRRVFPKGSCYTLED